MKTKMMFGLLAVIVAAAAISTIALPALASAVGNATNPNVLDATPIQDQVQSEAQVRQRLRLCDQTGVCAENCTQTQSRIRAMDGSGGLCNGTCTGDGSQYRYGAQQQVGGATGQTSNDAGNQSRGRSRNQSCLVTPTG